MAKKKNKMTLDELKKKKIDFESSLLQQIKDFEKETGLHVNWLNVERSYGDETEAAIPRKENEGKIVNVGVDVQFGELF